MLVNYCPSLSQAHKTTKEIWPRIYIENKIKVSIIVYIPYCHTENALKRSKNQGMWLRFYIEDKVEVIFIISVLHYHSEYASKFCSKKGKTKKYSYMTI